MNSGRSVSQKISQANKLSQDSTNDAKGQILISFEKNGIEGYRTRAISVSAGRM